MLSYILPILILSTLLYGVYRKVNIYNAFVFGAKSALDITISTLPNIVAIFVLIEVYSASGLNDIVARILSPVLHILGIPKELYGLILLKPFSGSGSIAILDSIISTYGTTSYITRCACAIVGSSEAIFYVSSVYFVRTKVTRFGIVILIALIANLIGAIVACNICRIL